jgi:hypothetical protein
MFREPRVRGTSTVENRYQAKTGEDTAERKDSVPSVVTCKLRELAMAV